MYYSVLDFIKKSCLTFIKGTGYEEEKDSIL